MSKASTFSSICVALRKSQGTGTLFAYWYCFLRGASDIVGLMAKQRKKNPHAVALGRAGGKRRAQKQTAKQRSDSARFAATRKWEQIRAAENGEPSGARR